MSYGYQNLEKDTRSKEDAILKDFIKEITSVQYVRAVILTTSIIGLFIALIIMMANFPLIAFGILGIFTLLSLSYATKQLMDIKNDK